MRLLSLMSGGIDSPVASHLMLAKGHEVDLIHFDNRPYTEEGNYEKVVSLARRVGASTEAGGRGGRRPRLFVAPHGKAQTELARKTPRRLGCVLCRRIMFRVSSSLAEREGYDALVTGESLGQVASQTLANISVEEPAASIPVMRPLIGLDKVDIIAIAEAIGTYGISTSPGLCCTIVPERPATRAKLAEVEVAEVAAGMDGLVRMVLEGVQEVDY